MKKMGTNELIMQACPSLNFSLQYQKNQQINNQNNKTNTLLVSGITLLLDRVGTAPLKYWHPSPGAEEGNFTAVGSIGLNWREQI